MSIAAPLEGFLAGISRFAQIDAFATLLFADMLDVIKAVLDIVLMVSTQL